MRDLYAGLVLGLVIGTLAYRSVYAALFDSRYNHIPLPPFSAKTQFSYRKGERGALELSADESKEPEKEVDKLVVWSWWVSGSTKNSKEKEGVWLRNIRSMVLRTALIADQLYPKTRWIYSQCSVLKKELERLQSVRLEDVWTQILMSRCRSGGNSALSRRES
jgi:hypothetical protein